MAYVLDTSDDPMNSTARYWMGTHRKRTANCKCSLWRGIITLKNLLAWRVKPNPKKHFKITHNSSRFLSVTPCLHTDSTQTNGSNCPFTERPKSRLFFSKATSHFNFFVDAICKTKTDVLDSHWRPLTAQKCQNSRNNEQLFHGTSHSPREMCGKARVDILSLLDLNSELADLDNW